jgi:hypothetical protein
MEVNELLSRYARGKRDFGFVNLQGVNLAGSDLTGIALHQANLEGALLTGVNFSNANLRQANLRGADLSQANLRQANLRRANLKDAILEGTILDDAILTGAILPDGTSYDSASIQDVDADVEVKDVDARPASSLEDIPPISPVSMSAQAADMGKQNVRRSSLFHQPKRYVAWAPLLLLWLGFIFFGVLLALQKASVFSWLIVWSGSMIWWFGDALAWFIPIVAAIGVFTAAEISVITLGTSGLVAISVFIVLKVMLDWSFPKALKDSLWVAGLGAILVQLASWLFYGGDAYSGKGITIAFDTVHLGLLLIVAIGLTSLGVTAWLQLLAEGFSKKTTFGIVGLVSALGLLCGRVIVSL